MIKREDPDSRDDGPEVDPDSNQYDVFIEDVNDGEEKNIPT